MSDRTTMLTAVINIHREGLWAHKAIRSALAALAKFPPDSTELVIVADRVDDATWDVAMNALHLPGVENIVVRHFTVDVGDLGRARNHGVMAASGKYVAFLDGDDVWGEEWPSLGVARLEELESEGCPDAVAHPLLNVDFGDNAFWWTQPDQRADDFDPAVFWNSNCWSSGAMAPRRLLLEQPYKPRTQGLGFEDWEWNARTLAAGILHTSVPRAVVFIRKKADGLNVESARKRQLVAHSDYFESRPDAMPRHKSIPFDPKTLSVDEEWLLPQWKAAHRIEPALWPDARAMRGLPRYAAEAARAVPSVALAIAERWADAGKVCETEDGEVRMVQTLAPTHVILAPCLVKGGADKRVIAYAEAVVRSGGRPYVLLTDRPDDPSWAGAIPDDVRVTNIHELLKGAGNDAAVLGLARLLMRWKPTLHVVNSRTGYAVVASYGAALKDSGVPRIFCSLYGSEQSGEGRLGGAAFNGWFWESREHIDCVLSDNNAHLAELDEVHGWPGARTSVAPTPLRTVPPATLLDVVTERGRKAHGALRVLWASRIVRGKRLDRLLAVAKLVHERKQPIVFAVAGEPADDWSMDVLKELRALPNVKVSAKAFDGWADLRPEKHDVFMFTSETEGMPNVVLEAMSFGLPVVSTAVGDVLDTPAWLVGKLFEDKAADWIETIVRAAAEPKLGERGVEYVGRAHSIEAFDAGLAKAGYFTKEKA